VLAAPRTVCVIHPANAPSLRLAERLGYIRFAETWYKGRDAVLLERQAKTSA
jgi:RimJ/RimL family protein N-acetyltransferase